jgi:hypothetical protein
MITLKTFTSDGSLYQVYDDDKIIGVIRRDKGPSGDRYVASLDVGSEGEKFEKEFHASHDALRWIEKNWPKSGTVSA